MKKFNWVLQLLTNKYFITVAVFLVWIAFCDRNDLLTQFDRKQELNKLEQSASFYQSEIDVTKKELTDLNNDPAILEKLSREKFYLKRKNEEVFIITDSPVENN